MSTRIAATAAGSAAPDLPGCAAATTGKVDCGALLTPGGTPRAAVRPEAAAATPAGLSPANLISAYALPSTTAGTGQTVAVVTAFDDATAETDLGSYRSQYSLSACTTANGCFSKVDQSGGTSYPAAGPAGWSLATAQALDMISAACPACHIRLVEADSTAITDLGPAENEAVTLGARFVTNTWFTPEATYGTSEPGYDSSYFDHPGVAITAPDGNGAGYGTYYPAASPDVIAVGGTTLTTSSTGSRGWTETAWNGTGSGCSPYEAKPSWQTDTGCSTRMLNDVSAVADPADSPVAFYDTSSGGWVTGGGDNAAAALIAAAYALAGTPASDSSPASYLYANAKGLNDITAGNDGTCSPSPAYFCTAGTGYDGPAGLGTPQGVSAFLSSYYQPISPVRLLDTRNGTGGTTGPVTNGTAVKLTVAGASGIPAANVTAVAVNLTALPGAADGFIVAYPDGATRPSTSNLDYDATPVANLAIVPVGADGKIDLYVAGGSTQLLADVSGYFTSDATATGDTTYTPLTPTRILDTRSGTGTPIAAGATLPVQVGGAHGIPSGISAVAVNLTAVNKTGDGFLEAWADGVTRPTASIVQFTDTQTIASMAIVPVAADGKIDLFVGGTSGGLDVVADVSGYFTGGTTGQAYHAMRATRLIDTRNDAKPVASDAVLAVAQGTAVVAPAPTMIINVTAVAPTEAGTLVTYAAGTTRPSTSTLNYHASETVANVALGATGGGSVDIYNASSGTVQLVVDCQGYFSAG